MRCSRTLIHTQARGTRARVSARHARRRSSSVARFFLRTQAQDLKSQRLQLIKQPLIFTFPVPCLHACLRPTVDGQGCLSPCFLLTRPLRARANVLAQELAAAGDLHERARPLDHDADLARSAVARLPACAVRALLGLLLGWMGLHASDQVDQRVGARFRPAA